MQVWLIKKIEIYLLVRRFFIIIVWLLLVFRFVWLVFILWFRWLVFILWFVWFPEKGNRCSKTIYMQFNKKRQWKLRTHKVFHIHCMVAYKNHIRRMVVCTSHNRSENRIHRMVLCKSHSHNQIRILRRKVDHSRSHNYCKNRILRRMVFGKSHNYELRIPVILRHPNKFRRFRNLK